MDDTREGFSPSDPDVDAPMDELFMEPPAWPKVVGIISIVVGAFFLGCLGCGIASMKLGNGLLASSMPGYQLPSPGIGQWAMIVVGGALDILLIVAGVLTIQRSAAGRGLHLLYAVAAIPTALLATWINMSYNEQVNSSMRTWAEQNPNEPVAAELLKQPPGGGIAQQLGVVFGLAVGLAYPLFLLVWFGLAKRRHEQMTGGIDEVI